MRSAVAVLVCLLSMSTVAAGGIIVSQTHVAGGGVARWSQLWQDPGPNGNDLDGDSICWQGFSLSQPAQIDGIEWWGTGACELGFQIEFWRQDPGTMAYQPLAVRESTPGVAPEARFRITPSDLTTSAGRARSRTSRSS